MCSSHSWEAKLKQQKEIQIQTAVSWQQCMRLKAYILLSPGLILFLLRQAPDENIQTLRKCHCQRRQFLAALLFLCAPLLNHAAAVMGWSGTPPAQLKHGQKAEVRPEITEDCVLWDWQLLMWEKSFSTGISAVLIAISVILAGTLNSLQTLN